MPKLILKAPPNTLDKDNFPSEYTDNKYASDTFSIESLKNAIKTDLARPNRFKVIIYPPQSLSEEFDYEYFTVMAKKANMPSVTINEVRYERAGKILHIPTFTEFGDLSISFFNDVNYRTRFFFFRWQKLILSNWEKCFIGPPALSLQGSMEVQQYDGYNKSTASIQFTNCWPKSVSNIEFSHDSDNQVSDFTVDFYYTQQNMWVAKNE